MRREQEIEHLTALLEQGRPDNHAAIQNEVNENLVIQLVSEVFLFPLALKRANKET